MKCWIRVVIGPTASAIHHGCRNAEPTTSSWPSGKPLPPIQTLCWCGTRTYLEVSNGFGRAKRTAMLALLDGMLARGVPIHGIGLEAHLRGDQAAVLGDESYEAFSVSWPAAE